VRVNYDEEANAAYITLGEASLRPVKTIRVPDIAPRMVNLDFDGAGHLVGIEVLDAREVLPEGFIAHFANPS
jgi:uncharacterized protein YuzE